MSGEELGQIVGLSVTELGEEDSIGNEHRRGVPGEIPIGVQSVHTAVERQTGIVIADLRLQGGDFRRGYVRRIGDEQIESAPGRRRRSVAEGIGLVELDAVPETQSAGVVACNLQGGLGQLHGVDFEVGASSGEGEGQATGTRPEIDGPTGFIGQELERPQGQAFGFGTRNKDVGGDPQFEIEERGGADEMLEGNPLRTSGDQRLKTRPGG